MALYFRFQAEKTSAKAFSAIRSLWNTFQVDKVDTSGFNTKEDKDDLAGRRQCKLLTVRLHLDDVYIIFSLTVFDK